MVEVAQGEIWWTDLPMPAGSAPGFRRPVVVVQLTKDATRISPADHAPLRAVGLDDQGILQITRIASWFNYINRVADPLGVGRE